MQHFLDPRAVRFPGTFSVAVIGELTPDNLAARGHLKSVTPVEQPYALLLALAHCIKSDASIDELQKWRKLILSAPTVFKACLTDADVFWAAIHRRHYEFNNLESTYCARVCLIIETRSCCIKVF